MFTIKVHESIFEQNPTYRRALVIATGLRNHGADPELEGLLQNVCQEAARQPINLGNDSRFTAWTEAHRRFCNPNRFPPAHLALRKRVQRPGTMLPFINKAVAIMNICSIAESIPVGGDDLTALLQLGTELELRPATGHERFSPLGEPEQQEHPEPGEIILTVNGTVCCRRWCWRNGHPTRITEGTAALIMNIDGLGPGSETRVVASRNRVVQLLQKHCQASVGTGLVSPDWPKILASIKESRPWEPTEGSSSARRRRVNRVEPVAVGVGRQDAGHTSAGDLQRRGNDDRQQ
jgi:DNA/RNA-binding domain of Phe-tRNA-synthetase-like protein